MSEHKKDIDLTYSIFHSLGTAIAQIDDAHIGLSKLERNQTYSLGQFLVILKEQYIISFLADFYKILLSIDILGNPANILNTLHESYE